MTLVPDRFDLLERASANGQLTGRRVHVVSLGCPKARVDTEPMVGLMEGEGAALTEAPEDADTIVINTCAFLESATQESIDTILEMAAFKQGGSCQRLVVTGCAVQRYGQELVAALPEVDTFLGTNEYTRIAAALTGELPERAYLSAGSHLYRAGAPRFPSTRGATTYLKVAEGCNRTCSFCIIPDIRGRQVSRPVDDLLDEARRLADLGIREVILIAQDLTSFGVDHGRRDALEELLLGLDRLEGLSWVRLMYCYPWNFTDRLVGILRDAERVVPYVDIPLQHISDRILTSMRRNVKRAEQERLLEKLRAVDGMVLRTTFITGYPGETDAEFRELCDWVREVEFDRVGCFTYSVEEGTRAAKLEGQVPEKVKQARHDELMGLQQEISLRRNQALVGRRLDVLVDGISDEHELVLEGRYYGQAPEIDGVVYLSFEDDAALARPGELVSVEIVEAAEYDLVGAVR
jgi:ribosomal protein S12 methylthiotransferase